MSSLEPTRRHVIPIKAHSCDDRSESLDATVSLYVSEKTIHPKTIQGVFSRWRTLLVVLTQLVFYGLPWLQWGQRQMVLFDLEARRFYIFGLVLYPQDFIYLTGLLIISAMSLFLFTAIAGRLWCGFACPQTVYTEIFMWVERHIEGDRSSRLRLEAGRWTWEKIWKKASKHGIWLSIALWTGYTFVGYFVPIRTLGGELLSLQGTWQLFWVGFYSFATYGNAGFMREQVCKYMCPYARFQSAMFDKDTLIVSYDQSRGEPRGARKKTDNTTNLGHCIDCTLCVQVCPAGIDIRDGLQYECIGCGLCVDACNKVMDKVGFARGLIRYATQRAVMNGWGTSQIWRRIFRPRVLVYSAILLALCSSMLLSLWMRSPFKVDVVRDRAALSRIVAGGKLENVYRVQIMNATEQPQTYHLRASGLEGLQVSSDDSVRIDPAQSRWVAVRLQIPYGSASAGSHVVWLHIDNVTDELQAGNSVIAQVKEKAVFIVPR